MRLRTNKIRQGIRPFWVAPGVLPYLPHMLRNKQIRSTASFAAQVLALSIAILLLTNAGRQAVAKFGLVHVLLGALIFFVVAEVSIMIAVVRYHAKSASTLPAGQTPENSSQLGSTEKKSSART